MDIYNHEGDGIPRTAFYQGWEMSYQKCRHCGKVLFENEPNPYFNMDCNSRAGSFEEFRNQLK